MTNFRSTMWEGDPVKHPELIPFDTWWSFGLCLIATCQGCGRERVVSNTTLMELFGRGGTLDERVRRVLAPRLKCGHCERHNPVLTTEVRKG